MNSIINIISTYFPQISNYFLFNKFPIFLLESLSLSSTATYNNCSGNIGPQICVLANIFGLLLPPSPPPLLFTIRNWQREVGAIGNWQPVYAAQIIANRLTTSWVESVFFFFLLESSSKLQFD